MPPKKKCRTRPRFKVITPFRSLVLCGKQDQDMEEWIKNVAESRPVVDTGTAGILGGHHKWYATGHARPTYCNVCRDVLNGVTSQGLSCEVCKYKVHKRCSKKAINNCKWTTLSSIGKDIIEEGDGNIIMPHQWMEGNLPVSAKCVVCDKTCGSVLRLQDWRCLWCKDTVHTACRPSMSVRCQLGPAKLSVVPPIALHSIGNDEAWDAVRPVGCSPLLVFVNSKSGDNQGIKFLRRFKQLLNPAQVFDLIKGGPGPGLRLFRHFDPFRILVCSGDGSVGWVLSEIDRLGMHKQCQVGVLPLGTGNDLARVLGWGASCDDDTNLAHLLEKYEKASTKMLDRWSIMTFERGISLSCGHKILPEHSDSSISQVMIQEYEDSVMSYITSILTSEKEEIVISSAKLLRQTVKDFALKIADTSLNQSNHHLDEKGDALQRKLDLLLETLRKEQSYFSENVCEEANADTIGSDMTSLDEDKDKEKGQLEKTEKDMKNLQKKKRGFQDNQAVISRANSLKRAIRLLVEHTEQAVEEKLSPKASHARVPSQEETDAKLLDIPEGRPDSAANLSPTPTQSSGNGSACSSPTPNLVSLSPMPDIRRDSQGVEDLLTLPAPDGFADSRRASSDLPDQESVYSLEANTVISAVEKLNKHKQNVEISEQAQDKQGEGAAGVAKTAGGGGKGGAAPPILEMSSPSDDTTIQDVISPDTDSMALNDSPPESKSINGGRKIGTPMGSCSNSDISSESLMSDSFNYLPKNSESEIDSDILDSTKHSESYERICHIDSPENSDLCMSEIVNSESMVDDLSSLNQDLISTMLMEKYDSVRECLDNEQMEKIPKYPCLAKFGDGSDIGRRSFKRKPPGINREGIFKDMPVGPFSKIVERISGENSNEQSPENEKPQAEEEKINLLNAPQCSFTVNSSPSPPNDAHFPPAISVIVDPPSPSASIKSKNDHNFSFHNLFPHLRRFSNGSMERLSVELPEGTGCSPHASRRISVGSLMKAPELASLAASAAKFGSNMSLRHERSKSIDKTDEVKKLPIINPLTRLPAWPNVSGGLISQALLANADALCAAVSPLMDPDETLMEGYFEHCVMNNYFGIGIDAKITLDFHHKREEHPEKCKSRAKNYMWYGVLGSKQWLQKTYKNLDQRVQLECDGQRIPLPALQGIVILNIPSFMGGTNFWGGSKQGDIFLAPSFDDRILEVVAVFGSVQMAASRLINLQHHRIAQCQSIQINILGDEGVPVQVDGEAWIQAPGIIRIIHKNRMQMLYRNRALETSLRAWEEKQRTLLTASQLNATASMRSRSNSSVQYEGRLVSLSEEERHVLFGFLEVTFNLVKFVKVLIVSHPCLAPDLYQVAERTAASMEKVHPDGKIVQGPNLRPVVTELISSARQLYEESCELLRDMGPNLKLREDLENKLSDTLASMEQELRKCVFDERGDGHVYLQNLPEEQIDKKNRHRGLFWLKFRRNSARPIVELCRDQVTLWGTQEVCSWLENLELPEYTENFSSHDVRGKELLTLARRDLKDLGIEKIGHLKRIEDSIEELKKRKK